MSPSLDELVKQGEGAQDAVDLGDGIFMSRNIANSYLVTTSGGDLIINTGTDFEASEIKARFARISNGPLTSNHFHPGPPRPRQRVEPVQPARGRNDRSSQPSGRSRVLAPPTPLLRAADHEAVGCLHGRRNRGGRAPPEPVLTESFIDSHAFDLGGRQFELYSTPGGETTDAMVVWMPEHRTVFIGNLMGPFFGHVPNLYTLRGDKIRSAMTFMHSVDRVIALQPETLINGHDVFHGADEIAATMTKVRDATAYLRDRTIDGMNSGANLWTLMRDVTLPPELALPQVHGKVSWIVRAIWEEHVGWFRYESTTELYACRRRRSGRTSWT